MAPQVPASLRLVESFLNSIDLESGRDDLDSIARFQGWLIANRRAAAGEGMTVADLQFARDLRDALRDDVRTHDDSRTAGTDGSGSDGSGSGGSGFDGSGSDRQGRGGADWARINALAAQVMLRAVFTAGGVGLAPGEAGPRAVLGEVLAAVVLADREGVWRRMKICRAETCQLAFYDRSKNSSRCWCSMSVCGNRNKTRAYRGRRRYRPAPADLSLSPGDLSPAPGT